MSEIYRASTTAPVNIAVIKYWGKRDPKLNLPTNSSLSVTLSQNDLRTHTTASCSPSYPSEDTLLLNGSPQDVSGARTQACFRELRALRKELEDKDGSLPKLSSYPLKIVSENNFPTAAGLASSAAGFAALVRAIANLYELPASPTDLSRIARQGSGSACRSLFGGYVGWEQGTAQDGSDSVAFQVAPASHWPNMRAIILVVSAAKKGVSSTTGMQTTVATSSLFSARANETVPRRMKEMQEAVQNKDFESFAKTTMVDSNSFHATCLDTYPPIFYLNDVSRAAIKVVEAINAAAGKIIAAYTFDAGPNAVIYYLEENEKDVAGLFKVALGEKEGWAVQRGEAVQANSAALDKVQQDAGVAVDLLKEGVSRIILTGVGEGPVKTDESLINEKGEPVSSA
ncbi:diphosphomevalonate decarboxylase [Aaosphaeria arxii CBS 175.79]|uniref:Diphosphomevalonate decarboxylase n=1 Tax=Aaosphaeria arxii CBS 175.79 TaxID=1450172 RepID=A0A6A5XKB8_9PLEO|nr:diphosphomevalonate decarboxylase [Aaosphaeria arxii CBS 175.79]KAF2013695.1 diphosphomevalonate decarboxylase [Aaosphaeria arxii CBS 175.79]